MAVSKGTIVVTGANGGLGSAIVSKIVSTPELAAYHGLYTVRNASTASALHSMLQSAIKAASPHPHDILSLDLARLADVRKVAGAINERVAVGELPPIRALVLNAGYQEYLQQSFNEDGFDLSFAANYLGHWLLTLMLLKSMDRERGRVIVVGSWAHKYVPPCSSSLPSIL